TDYRWAAWYVGYTPNMAAAVWMGDPAHAQKMINVTIGGHYYPKVYGADGPAPIWKDAVSGALANQPALTFVTVPINVPDKKQQPKQPGKPGQPAPTSPQPGQPAPLPTFPTFGGHGGHK